MHLLGLGSTAAAWRVGADEVRVGARRALSDVKDIGTVEQRRSEFGWRRPGAARALRTCVLRTFQFASTVMVSDLF